MAQKAGPTLPNEERLAVQAELLARKAESEEADGDIARPAGLTAAAINQARRTGKLGTQVRDKLLKHWGVPMSALLKKHHDLIERVKFSKDPGASVRLLLEAGPAKIRGSASFSAAVQEAASVLVELDGLPPSEAKAIALDAVDDVPDLTVMTLYRAARRRLAVMAKSSSPIK